MKGGLFFIFNDMDVKDLLRKAGMKAWQLPQWLLGCCLSQVMAQPGCSFSKEGVKVHAVLQDGMLPLGTHLFLRACASSSEVDHGMAHCRQSRKLGWLYLPVIGVPMFVNWSLWKFCSKMGLRYDKSRFFTERWLMGE